MLREGRNRLHPHPRPTTARLLLPLLALVLPGTLSAQTLLRDFNTAPPLTSKSSWPRGFAPTPGGDLLFAASGIAGRELWRTDGTAAGTHLVADIAPSVDSSLPTELTELSPGVFVFVARTQETGFEIWRTDGTQAGTRIVRDLLPGPFGSEPMQLTRLGNRVVFLAAANPQGLQPWITNGTKYGTTMLPGVPASSALFSLDARVAVTGYGEAVFTSFASTSKWLLWATNGTATGTRFVADASVANGTPPDFLTRVGNDVVMRADLDGQGAALVRTDGRTAGTFAIGPAPVQAPVTIGTVAFYAADVHGGRELWRTDGSASGTFAVVDLLPGQSDEVVLAGQVQGVACFFAGTSNRALYRTDGTAAGTTMISAVAATGSAEQPEPEVGGFLYFRQPSGLFRTDGTPAGTTLVTPLDAGEPAATANGIVLRADDGSMTGTEVYTTDGTPSGTQLLADLYPTPVSGSSFPTMLGRFRDLAVLFADDGVHGVEPWVTDGTPAGTRLLQDLVPGSNGSSGIAVVAGESRMMLLADMPGLPDGPVFSDGTPAGTVRPSVLPPGALIPIQQPGRFGTTGDRFVFEVLNPTTGREPWITDGTPAGTYTLGDLNPGVGDSMPRAWMDLGDRVVFQAATSTGYFWATDGTAAGTVPLAPPTVRPLQFAQAVQARFGSRIWFAAGEPATGEELWSTDGTPGGTRLEMDLRPGPLGSNPDHMVTLGDRLLLRATVDGFLKLVMTDGTAAGTTTMQLPGLNFEGPYPCSEDRALLLVVMAGAQPDELWSTDGTIAGTAPVTVLPFGFHPSEMHRLGVDRTLLMLPEPISGERELWSTDGTTAGTFRMLPANVLANANGIARTGDQLVASAETYTYGAELYAIPFAATGDWAREHHGTGCPGTGGVAPSIALHGTARASAPQPWDITIEGALPNAACLFAISQQLDHTPLPGGCALHLGGQPVTLARLADATGTAAMTIPPTAALTGLRFVTQWFAVDPQGTAFGLLSATEALEFVIGP